MEASVHRHALLQVAFGSPETAARRWAQIAPHIDLSPRQIPDHDLLPLVAHRLMVLGIDDERRPVLSGLMRRTFYANQLMIRDFFERVDLNQGQSPIVGRAATVFGFLPSSAMLEIGAVEQPALRDTPARAAKSKEVLGRTVWFPSATTHFLDMAQRGWVVDALAAAQDPTIEWLEVATEANRRRTRHRVQEVTAMVREVTEVEIPSEVAALLAGSRSRRLAEVGYWAVRRVADPILHRSRR